MVRQRHPAPNVIWSQGQASLLRRALCGLSNANLIVGIGIEAYRYSWVDRTVRAANEGKPPPDPEDHTTSSLQDASVNGRESSVVAKLSIQRRCTRAPHNPQC